MPHDPRATPRSGSTSALTSVFGPALALVAIWAPLVQPNRLEASHWGTLAQIPLELPAIVMALLLARGAATTALRIGLTAFLAVSATLKLADFAAYLAFGRTFNPVIDLHLAPAGWEMLSGAVGLPLALSAVGAAAGVLALAAWAIWRATGAIAALRAPAGLRRACAVLLLPALALVALDCVRPWTRGEALTTRLAYERVRDGLQARADLAAFRLAAAEDPAAALTPAEILPRLAGRDVFVIFVESYGRTTLDNPLYAPTIRGALASMEGDLAARGLAMRSGFLRAPMTGGQSWLAHASVLSGLTISNQARYAALLASPRLNLMSLARDAGWRSVAVMPAISRAWPEAGYFGYDRVLDAAALDYAGRPFNWVTMPDQFTLLSFERQELDPPDRPPVFAELALISSHAPWTPIPPLLPWDAIGDGRVYDPYATRGDPPDVLWRDMDRVRDQFRRSIDYSLRAALGFVARRAEAGPPPLVFVLGDHQPASLASQDVGGQDVPIHAIGAPETLAALDAWGWTPGLAPAPDAPVWEMAAFRDRLLAAFGPETAHACASGPLPGGGGC